MNNIRIDYYTGTGGSELIANLLADKLRLSHKKVLVNRIRRNDIVESQTFDADYYILIFPIHSFNAPQPIYEWVKQWQGNGSKTAVISVSGAGDVVSNTASRNKTVKLLEQSGFKVIFEDMIRMPNSWMSVPKKKKFTRILSVLPSKIESISTAILSEKEMKRPIYWIDYFISALGEAEKKGTSKFGTGITVTEKCTSCGLCVSNCCSSNIHLDKPSAQKPTPKPIFSNQCDMCLGCIYNCPNNALKATIMASQVDKNGYNIKKMCKIAAVNI